MQNVDLRGTEQADLDREHTREVALRAALMWLEISESPLAGIASITTTRDDALANYNRCIAIAESCL